MIATVALTCRPRIARGVSNSTPTIPEMKSEAEAIEPSLAGITKSRLSSEVASPPTQMPSHSVASYPRNCRWLRHQRISPPSINPQRKPRTVKSEVWMMRVAAAITTPSWSQA